LKIASVFVNFFAIGLTQTLARCGSLVLLPALWLLGSDLRLLDRWSIGAPLESWLRQFGLIITEE